jgi:hypothetical protein
VDEVVYLRKNGTISTATFFQPTELNVANQLLFVLQFSTYENGQLYGFTLAKKTRVVFNNEGHELSEQNIVYVDKTNTKIMGINTQIPVVVSISDSLKKLALQGEISLDENELVIEGELPNPIVKKINGKTVVARGRVKFESGKVPGHWSSPEFNGKVGGGWYRDTEENRLQLCRRNGFDSVLEVKTKYIKQSMLVNGGFNGIDKIICGKKVLLEIDEIHQ